MADPKWAQRFFPVMDRAISLLAGLLDGDLFDKLLAKGCLSTHQYEEMLRLKGRESPEDVARRLSMVLRRRASPSFDIFLSVLKNVEQGSDLRDLLK